MGSSKVHPTAIVDSHAEIGAGCEVGPYCVIGANVKLGEGCRLHSHVVVDGLTTIGPRCEFFPFACIGLKTQDLKFFGGKCYLEIGSDNVFREHVTIHTATSDGDYTRIGSHNNFLAYAHIAHDCVVGNHVIFSNNGTLAGHILVEDYAVVGGLAAVHQFCRIGRMAIIGGCTKVVQDIPPYMMADGNPAVCRGVNQVGLERNGVAEETRRALREAYKIVFRAGLTVSNALDKVSAEVPRSIELEHFIDFCRKSERGIAR
jgi:UDP-N-acetylglucosamine acyltransferase